MQIHEPKHWHLAWRYIALAAKHSAGSPATDRRTLITATPNITRLEATNGWGYLAAEIPVVDTTEENWRHIIAVDERTNHVADESNQARSLPGIGAQVHLTPAANGRSLMVTLEDDEPVRAQPRIVDEEYPAIRAQLERFTPQPHDGRWAFDPAKFNLPVQAGLFAKQPNMEVDQSETEVLWETTHRDEPDVKFTGWILLKG